MVSWAESKDIAEGVYWRDGALMRKWRPPDRLATEEWSLVEQIVVPQSFHEEILLLAHEAPMAGDTGIQKSHRRILQRFYWPKLHKDLVA